MWMVGARTGRAVESARGLGYLLSQQLVAAGERVLVNRVPEWRYGQTGESILWYNSMTLYRQGDHWPLEKIATAVKKI